MKEEKFNLTFNNPNAGYIYVTMSLNTQYVEEQIEKKLSTMEEFKEVEQILKQIQSKHQGK